MLKSDIAFDFNAFKASFSKVFVLVFTVIFAVIMK